MSGVPVYGMQVECMAYCYGGSPALEVDEYPDASDPHAVVKYADHVAALAKCEERMEESMDRAWAKAVVEIEAHARSLALDAAQKSILALHKPAPVIECECGWGYHCPECGSESNRIIGYACSQCCNSWPHTAYCDDMHNEDGTPLHHPNGVMWSGPHCPVIAAIDALRKES